MREPDLDWYDWIDYRDDLPTPDDLQPVLSTGHAKEATQ